MDAGAAEDTEVDDMVVDTVVDVGSKEYVVEVAMFITHMNSPSGTENL